LILQYFDEKPGRSLGRLYNTPEREVMPTQIREQDVRKRLAAYKDLSITDELYAFGQRLIDDAVDRLSKSDTKAGAIAAYSGGLIALLTSTSSLWALHLESWHLLMPMLAVSSVRLKSRRRS
jgi:hypothetical protein